MYDDVTLYDDVTHTYIHIQVSRDIFRELQRHLKEAFGPVADSALPGLDFAW